MQYVVYGTIEDEPIRITWTDGYIDGDEGALEELFALAGVLEGKRVGPEPHGPFTVSEHLADPLSALVLIEDVLDEVITIEGDYPEPAITARRRA